jgi:hypothetical protein
MSVGTLYTQGSIAHYKLQQEQLTWALQYSVSSVDAFAMLRVIQLCLAAFDVGEHMLS